MPDYIPTHENKRVIASTLTRYEFFTPWMHACGVDSAKPLILVKAATGQTITVDPSIQTATVRPENPDAPASLGGTTQSGEGELSQAAISVTATTNGKSFVRFGAKVTTAQGEGQADVTMHYAINTCGRVVARSKVTCVAPSSAVSHYKILGGWLPVSMVTKLTASFTRVNAHADLKYRPIWHFADTTQESPGVWNNSGTWLGSSQGNGAEHCTTEITVTPPGTEHWVQFGVEFISDSANNITGTLDVTLRVRN